ncbi:LytR C-terminal domain-containing protein [Arcanobacterium bovis]|uniref:LytR family transcriptional regulator n=1 Tax=Arcanobacterium bovis TaxID=2529275 RepID=A0A4Q9V3Y4_9ACTO|nr:LytR C-terminal domain-containing protein [Arcanobacterium bovis]TBW23843.1 LytR family transcriptional regulator [Arcanobacterium bovis]
MNERLSESKARSEYRKKIHERQVLLFGIIGAVMLFLLLINTLFSTGLVPFPFKHDFSRKEGVTLVYPCANDDAKPADLKTIPARVFNASGKSGVAKQVSDALKARGVQVSATANWDGEAKVSESTRILTGVDGINNAYTLRAFFPQSKIVFDSTLKSEIVDVVIGEGWQEMHAQPTEQDFLEAMKSQEKCTKDL